MRKSIFDLEEDFHSSEDLLLYFFAIQQKINRFQKTIFHKKNFTKVILEIWESLRFKPKLQTFERAVMKMVSRKHFKDHLSTARFVSSIYLEHLKCIFERSEIPELKNQVEKPSSGL